MEKIIEEIVKELKVVADGKPKEPLRKKMGEEITVCFLRVALFSLQWTSVGYHSALRLAGIKLGRRLGEESEKTEFTLILEEVKRTIIALKGGRVEIEINPELGGAQLKLYDSLFTSDLPNVQQNLCFFEEGFIEGYFDGTITKKGPLALSGAEFTVDNVSVEEKRCLGLGDNHCGFLIKFLK
jgi:predicted hydrocarbon binding protein